MTTSNIRALLLIGLLALLAPVGLFSQSPCYGNGQAGAGICHPSDTAKIWTWGYTCSTCVYTWNPIPINGQGVDTAEYVFPATYYPQVVSWPVVTMNYYDPALSCTGTAFWHYDVGVPGLTQMGNPELLNGPYDGDTSKVWVYVRRHNEWTVQDVSNWDFWRSYSVTGGTLLSSTIGYWPDWNGDITDTLRVKWDNTSSRNINCSGSLNIDGINLSMQVICNGYAEEIPPQPLNDAFPIGPANLCVGDTATYYTTFLPTATYTWSVTGGNILSGQGTDQIEVEWTSLPGSVNVSRVYNSNTSSNSLTVNPPASPTFSLGNDTLLCQGATLPLTAPSSSSYLWSTSATTQSITVSDSGTYWVTIPMSFCGVTTNVTDTIVVDTVLPIHPDLGPDFSICTGTPNLLDAGPGFNTYTWSQGSVTQTISINMPNTYYVTTTDVNSCTGMDSITISAIPSMHVDLGPDTLICPGNSILIDAGPSYVSYAWSGGQLSQSITITAAGQYSVTVVDVNGCPSIDTLNVNYFPNSHPQLGNDTTVCVGESVSLSPGGGFVSYQWSNSSVTSTIIVSAPGSYSITTADPNGCVGSDTLILSNFPVTPINLGPDSFLCADTSVVLDAGSGLSNYLWNTGDVSQTITATSGQFYYVTATDANNCMATDSIDLQSLLDCVFPGDCDYDGVANNNDVLALGVTFGQNGPVRANASLQWYGQRAPDWSTNLPSGPNSKHCDSNGDGLVTNADTLAIWQNYGFTHSKTDLVQAGGPTLQVVATFDSVQAGDTAVYRVYLGDSINHADSVYGLAFTINYDTTLVDSNGLFFADYSYCWIGAPSQLLTFTKDLYPVPQADLAVARTNATDTSGYGEICRIGFVTIDNISGKRDLLAKSLTITLSDIRFINHEMMQLAISPSGDSTVVWQEELAAFYGGPKAQMLVYPIPASDRLGFRMEGTDIAHWEIRNLEGKMILAGEGKGESKRVLDVSQLRTGMYFLQVTDSKGIQFVQKVPLLRH